MGKGLLSLGLLSPIYAEHSFGSSLEVLPRPYAVPSGSSCLDPSAAPYAGPGGTLQPTKRGNPHGAWVPAGDPRVLGHLEPRVPQSTCISSPAACNAASAAARRAALRSVSETACNVARTCPMHTEDKHRAFMS